MERCTNLAVDVRSVGTGQRKTKSSPAPGIIMNSTSHLESGPGTCVSISTMHTYTSTWKVSKVSHSYWVKIVTVSPMAKAPTPSLIVIVLKPIRQSSMLNRRKIHQWEMNVDLETWNFQLDMTLQGSEIMIWKDPLPNQSNAPWDVPCTWWVEMAGSPNRGKTNPQPTHLLKRKNPWQNVSTNDTTPKPSKHLKTEREARPPGVTISKEKHPKGSSQKIFKGSPFRNKSIHQFPAKSLPNFINFQFPSTKEVLLRCCSASLPAIPLVSRHPSSRKRSRLGYATRSGSKSLSSWPYSMYTWDTKLSKHSKNIEKFGWKLAAED